MPKNEGYLELKKSIEELEARLEALSNILIPACGIELGLSANLEAAEYSYLAEITDITPDTHVTDENVADIPWDHLNLVFDSYKHSWRCNRLRQCETKYCGVVYVVDDRNNSPVTSWEKAWTRSKDNCNVAPDDNTYHREFKDYWAAFGFTEYINGELLCLPRRGRSRHVSARVRFISPNGGYVEWMVRSANCP